MTDPAALSTHAILQRATSGDGATRVVTLDARFQGLPGAAHGGTVLALFDAVASATGVRTIAGVYRRRVPLATPLELVVDRDRDATRLRLSDGVTLLVDGVVAAGAAAALGGAEAGVPRAGAGGGAEAEGGVKVLAHEPVLELGRLAQEVGELLAVLDDDLWLAHGR